MALKGTERVSEIRETWRRHFQAAFSLSFSFLLHPHKLHFRSPILGHSSTLLSELRSLRKHVPISEKHSSINQTRSISFETWGTQLTINKPLARSIRFEYENDKEATERQGEGGHFERALSANRNAATNPHSNVHHVDLFDEVRESALREEFTANAYELS